MTEKQVAHQKLEAEVGCTAACFKRKRRLSFERIGNGYAPQSPVAELVLGGVAQIGGGAYAKPSRAMITSAPGVIRRSFLAASALSMVPALARAISLAVFFRRVLRRRISLTRSIPAIFFLLLSELGKLPANCDGGLRQVEARCGVIPAYFTYKPAEIDVQGRTGPRITTFSSERLSSWRFFSWLLFSWWPSFWQLFSSSLSSCASKDLWQLFRRGDPKLPQTSSLLGPCPFGVKRWFRRLLRRDQTCHPES